MDRMWKRRLLIGLLVATGLAMVFTLALIIILGDEDSGVVAAISIGYLLLMCLSAFTAIDHRLWRYPAVVGIVLALITMMIVPIFALIISSRAFGYEIWMEIVMAIGLSTSGFCCLLAFVMAFKMRSIGVIVQRVIALSMLLLFCLFQGMIWDLFGTRSTEYERTFITTFIITVVGIVGTIILNKLFGMSFSNPISYAARAVHLTCPRCQKAQEIPVGEASCAFCKLKIKIEIEEPVCPKCGYNLHHLTRPVCPECGAALGPPDVQGDLAQAELVQWAKAADAQRP